MDLKMHPIIFFFQLSIREKMLSEIPIQRRKITMSIEKLQVHFGRKSCGANTNGNGIWAAVCNP